MGARLAQEALRRGHRVTLVSGPTELEPPPKAKTIRVESAQQMQQALRRQMPRTDVLIMAAAVSDFRPTKTVSKKLARRGRLSLTLEATPDIVANLPRRRSQLVVGFAVEASRVRERAARKLREKRLDLIVGQRLSTTKRGVLHNASADARQSRVAGGSAFGGNGTGSPFGHRAVHAFLLRSSGVARELGEVSKSVLARVLLDEIEQLWYGQKDTKGSVGGVAP